MREAGFLAWIVGGAPRDILCGKMPADLDLATSATPDEILKLFPAALPLGASFGVVVVMMKGLMSLIMYCPASVQENMMMHLNV